MHTQNPSFRTPVIPGQEKRFYFTLVFLLLAGFWFVFVLFLSRGLHNNTKYLRYQLEL